MGSINNSECVSEDKSPLNRMTELSIEARAAARGMSQHSLLKLLVG